VQEAAVKVIGRRRPVADELRHALSVLKIAAELERIGDLAKNIAHRGMAVSHGELPRDLMVGCEHTMELAAKQLSDVLDAWGTRDVSKALAIRAGDEQLDALYSSVFRDALWWMLEDPRHIELCAHLLFVAKNLERIGDHTTNIAEQIIFAVDGVVPQQERPKRDDTSTFSNVTTANRP
jgi:phosphate transport system protein